MTQFEHESERNWQACLADLVLACAAASPAQTSVLVRATHALLIAAPKSWRGQLVDLPSLDRIESQIAVGADLSAALSLVEGRGSYILSHGPASTHMATVAFEGICEEASATGETAALALVGALAAALAGPALDLGREHMMGFTSPSLRLN